MKRIIKYWPLAILLFGLCSCTVSQNEWDVLHEPPKTDGNIVIDPWEGQDSDGTLT